jgi:uncharacterized protein YdcH (DUF465 family)
LEKYKPILDNQVDDARASVAELKGDDKTIANLKNQIDLFEHTIKNLENEIEAIKQKKNRICELKKQRCSKYLLILNQLFEKKVFLQNMVNKFENDKDQMLDDLSLQSIIKLKDNEGLFDELCDKVNSISHSRDSLVEQFMPLYDLLHQELNADEFNVDNIEKIPIEIGEKGELLRTKKATEYSDLMNVLFQRSYRVNLLVKFKDKYLAELSMGERAVILLKLLLALDDKPLLIDQPEEHLDNRYIYDILVPTFRKAKETRQIIIATHNANLVVNTDAEQVIVADNDGGKISYNNGAIENAVIRDEITSILEGGEDAFRKREQKYGFIA